MDNERTREILERAYAILAEPDPAPFERDPFADEWQQAVTPQQSRSKPHRQHEAQQQARQWDAWDAWFDRRFDARVGPVVNMIADAIGAESGIDRRLLEKQIAELRADIEILRGVVKHNNNSNSAANVITLKGTTSDAA